MAESILTPIEQYIVDFVFKLRIAKSLSQEDIGNIIGVKQTFIANIENSKNRSKYNLNHINMLADHFGMSPQEFLPKVAFKE